MGKFDLRQSEHFAFLFQFLSFHLSEDNTVKNRKDLYEAKNPQAKKGGDKQRETAKVKLNAESALSFTKDTAAKTKKSKRIIQSDVQIATRIAAK